jgi:hypothetical protein
VITRELQPGDMVCVGQEIVVIVCIRSMPFEERWIVSYMHPSCGIVTEVFTSYMYWKEPVNPRKKSKRVSTKEG